MQNQSKIDAHNFVILCKQKRRFLRNEQKKAARKYKTQINSI